MTAGGPKVLCVYIRNLSLIVRGALVNRGDKIGNGFRCVPESAGDGADWSCACSGGIGASGRGATTASSANGVWSLSRPGAEEGSSCACWGDENRLSKSCEKTAGGLADNMAAATNRIRHQCPRFRRLSVMVLQPGKVFLLAKYRHHDECAVRKREASVDICRVSD